MNGSLLVGNIGDLATPLGFSARRGKAMSSLRRLKDAAVLIIEGTIVYAGPGSGPELDSVLSAAPAHGWLDAGGRACVPGFVDSHTHFLFAGFREDEFFWRAAGLPYMEIHRRGGGIWRSVQATRAAGRGELLAIGRKRLAAMSALGITTVEGKSGYGLDLDTELRQLDVMGELDGTEGVDIVRTFMGPHSVPGEYANSGNPAAGGKFPESASPASRYLDFVISEVLPEVARRHTAEFADIFCEKGVFEIGESRRFLSAAKAAGLKIKLHADEIESLGGAGLAAELQAVSADHLLKASREDIIRMAHAGVVATCLPLTAFNLREPFADARSMIDAGCAVALASDFNPGSCYSQSIPLIFALAVLQMGLDFAETLTALTLNGAGALGLADRTGSLEPGKAGDLLILDADSAGHLAYNSGMNLVKTVVKNGRVLRSAGSSL
jgi:imidazolonepropionase